MLKLTQKVAGAGSELDKTNQVDWPSLKKTEILSKEPDLLSFRVRNYGAKTWRPALNDEIYLYDTDGTTRIFGGVVVDVKDTATKLLTYVEVTCKDFTHTLDRKLVSKTYTSQTATDIITDFIANYSTGFTVTNVVAPVTINKIAFNYSTISKALQKVADYSGNYEWYVDYNKDIHFFQKGSRSAPFQIDDTSGNSIWDSLEIKTNTSQLRNKITIRGGLATGSSFTDKKIADGNQRTFFVGYDIESLVVEKALAATPTTFVNQTIGKDGVDPDTSFNVLYNPNDGLIRFPSTAIPAVNDVIRWSGNPRYPLVSETNELSSQSAYGIFEYLIIDKTILTKTAAKQRADAELARYSQPTKTATFKTDTPGLNTGETIIVNSPLRGINESFIITRIEVVCKTPTTYTYQIEATNNLTTAGIIDLMSNILSNRELDQIAIDANEVIDRLQSVNETITLAETFTVSKGIDQFETITLSETVTPQPLNYGTIFVLGPYTPTISLNGADTKRVFMVGGSLLG